MKLYEMLDMLGEGVEKPKGRNKKIASKEPFTIKPKLQASYDQFAENGVSLLKEGPVDIFKLMKDKLIGKSGESKFAKLQQKIAEGLGHRTKNVTIRNMTGWDGGYIPREISAKLGVAVLRRRLEIANGEEDVFAPFDWEAIYNESVYILMRDPEALLRLNKRAIAGHPEMHPTARAYTSDGKLGPTIGEFVTFLAISKMQDEYIIDMTKYTKESYKDRLSRYINVPLYVKGSTEEEEDDVYKTAEDPNAPLGSGHEGMYTSPDRLPEGV